MMKRIIFIHILFFVVVFVFGQNDDINPDGYNVFYYENGQISSEGYMKEGKPVGYWKNYYEDGILKSEGNRKNFELDSIWKFYDEEGNIKLKINYDKGKKDGIQTTYRKDEYMVENYEGGIKEGLTNYFYNDGTLKKSVHFKNGLEHGYAKEFSREGLVIVLIQYKKGFIVSREYINRKDKNDLRQGVWKSFHKNGIIATEATYRNDKLHGYYKMFDNEGNLLRVEKYENGKKIEDAEEIKKLEQRIDYYPDGSVKIVGHYNKNDKPDGIRREYDKKGNIIRSYIFSNGRIIGKGIVDKYGKKQGDWEEYYVIGVLRAKGKYKNNIKIGYWQFFHDNGKLEQEGYFNNLGKYDAEWRWYYPSGHLLREESFLNGVLDGILLEYSDVDTTHIITKGEYLDGLENGEWFYNLGDHHEEGKYVDGMRDGMWRGYHNNGYKSYEGRFVEDNPNGRHVYYWENGKIRDERNYVMGMKHGIWKKYNFDGSLLLIIQYRNGVEVKYDGTTIKPEITSDEL